MNYIKCGVEIHPKRLEIIPGCKTCVNCSTASPYRAITTVHGEGDHTWNDIQIVDQKTYEKYENLKTKIEKSKLWDDPEIID